MMKLTVPEVSFSLQAVVPNFPKELHEAIDISPEVVAFAAKARARVEALYNITWDAQSLCLAVSHSEGSWKSSGGPETAIRADIAALNLAHVSMLADGRNNDTSLGWVGRRDWDAIVEALFRTVFTVERPSAYVGQCLQLTDGGGWQYKLLGQGAEAFVRGAKTFDTQLAAQFAADQMPGTSVRCYLFARV